MKKIFIKNPNDGTIPLHITSYSGSIHVKILTNVVYIKSIFSHHSKILTAEPLVYKFTPRTFGLFTRQLREILTTRFPPRSQDWLPGCLDNFYTRLGSYDEIRFNTELFITKDRDRLVSISTTRHNKSVFINPKPFVFPWVHLGDVYKLFKQIADRLPTESNQNTPLLTQD